MEQRLPQKIALELVPHQLESLEQETRSCLSQFSVLDAINIPEIRRLPIKSMEATEHLLSKGLPALPHFRTIDRDIPTLVDMLERLYALGLREVLLITGDPPDEPGFESSQVTPLQATQALKKRFTDLKVHVGMDPYRSSFRTEMDYCKAKIDAGADGFFSQPFFCPHMLGMWLEQLPDVPFRVGISPVTSKSSRAYWENVNKVVFPADMQTSLEYNCRKGRELLALAAHAGKDAYLMPITISAAAYLPELFR